MNSRARAVVIPFRIFLRISCGIICSYPLRNLDTVQYRAAQILRADPFQERFRIEDQAMRHDRTGYRLDVIGSDEFSAAQGRLHAGTAHQGEHAARRYPEADLVMRARGGGDAGGIVVNGIGYVDAPVSGLKARADEGTLASMIAEAGSFLSTTT